MTHLQKQTSKLAILALAASMSIGAVAQSTTGGGTGSSSGNSGSGASAAGAGTRGGTTATGTVTGGMTSSSTSFQDWLNAQHGRRISRQAYMDEVGRRWDAMDRSNQGLTYDEINRTYGTVGNMGGPTANTPEKRSGIQK
jgi:hypothetical protein